MPVGWLGETVPVTGGLYICRDDDELKPNSITLASSELAPNMFGASLELVRSWFEAEIWPII